MKRCLCLVLGLSLASAETLAAPPEDVARPPVQRANEKPVDQEPVPAASEAPPALAPDPVSEVSVTQPIEQEAPQPAPIFSAPLLLAPFASRELWEKLRGTRVRVTLSDGAVLNGAVLGATLNSGVLALDGTRAVRAFNLRDVPSVEIAPRATGDGRAMLGAGIALSIFGLACVATGASIGSFWPTIGTTMWGPGIAFIGAGVPMTIFGGRKWDSVRAAKRRRR